jgi:hypothetical protein
MQWCCVLRMVEGAEPGRRRDQQDSQSVKIKVKMRALPHEDSYMHRIRYD